MYLGFVYERNCEDDRYIKQEEYYDKAIKAGCLTAYVLKGNLYRYAEGHDCDPEKARKYFQKAIDKGSDDGYLGLANLYHYGEGVNRSQKKAEKYYKKALESESLYIRNKARRGLAYLYLAQEEEGGEYKKTWKQIRAIQKDEYPDGWLLEGVMYQYGYGTKADRDKAVQAYKKAYKKGFSSGARYVGELLYYQENNMDGALEWYEKGAALGDGSAMMEYALLLTYLDQPDYEKAYIWFSRSAVCGNANACVWAGFLAMEGYGTEQDYGRALEWFGKAKRYYGLSESNTGYIDESVQYIVSQGYCSEQEAENIMSGKQ